MERLLKPLCILVLLNLVFAPVKATEVDKNGYIVYCPCMGRFGNQFEHFLGSIAFAKGLDRTLVLPPWVEYPPGMLRSKQVPFNTYIRVSKLKEYHRVITMEDFMKHLAPTLWPPGERVSFCYTARDRFDNVKSAKDSCNAKDGSPFGPFWDTFNIDFDKSEFYGPLYYDTWRDESREAWDKKFPANKFPVLAFTGAPASFPVLERNVELTKFVLWSNNVETQANKFIADNLKDEPFLGIHLRIGSDWKNVCDLIEPKRQLFASAQCLGYQFEHGFVTAELCLPSEKTIMKQLKATVKKLKAKSVFVATDSPEIIGKIQNALKKKVKVVSLDPPNPHVELAILTKADHYISSCVSTFSAVATRMRSTQNLGPTSFWALKSPHDEL